MNTIIREIMHDTTYSVWVRILGVSCSLFYGLVMPFVLSMPTLVIAAEFARIAFLTAGTGNKMDLVLSILFALLFALVSEVIFSKLHNHFVQAFK